MAPEPVVTPALTQKSISPFTAIFPHRIALNFGYLSAGEITAKVLTFLTFTYLARSLGPPPYGLLEFALAVMIFFTLPADLGLGFYGAREIARHPERSARLLHEITGLRMAFALCSMAALGVFILLIHKSAEVKLLLALYGASLIAGPFLLQWFFQAHDRMSWVGSLSIVRYGVFAAVVFLICRRAAPLWYVGLAECAAVTAAACFSVYLTRRMGCPWPWPDLRASGLGAHVRQAVPIGLSELAWACMWYSCTVLLGFFFSDATLGWFGASHRALMALHTFISLYFFNLLPSISRCVDLPREHLLRLMSRSIRFTAWTCPFAAAFLVAIAPDLLTLIYGPRYRAASASFAILVWMLPVAMLSGHHRYILIAYNRQGRLLGCTAISALAAVAFGVLLAPHYKGQGAACALLIAIVLNFALVYASVRRHVMAITVHRQLVAPLLALATAAGIYVLLDRWNPRLALLASSIWYLGILIWKDGPQLLTFLRTIPRNSARETIPAA